MHVTLLSTSLALSSCVWMLLKSGPKNKMVPAVATTMAVHRASSHLTCVCPPSNLLPMYVTI